jgi:hypothetical protein
MNLGPKLSWPSVDPAQNSENSAALSRRIVETKETKVLSNEQLN